MRTNNGPLPMLVGGSVVVVLLCTFMVSGGWMILIPVALAFGVVFSLSQSIQR